MPISDEFHHNMLGSEEEAIIYVHYSWRAWMWIEGAKDWLRKVNHYGRL